MLEMVYSLIVVVGIIAGRRFGRLLSFGLMIEMYQLVLFTAGFIITGRFHPVVLVPGVGVLPGIGRFSGISAGGLIPPLIFLLVAVFAKRRRVPTNPSQGGVSDDERKL